MRSGVTALIMFLSAVVYADPIDEAGHALLADRSYQVRAQAAIVLGKLKDRRSVPLLITALRDKEAAVRAIAASSLGKLGDSSALAALRARMDDPELLVRGAAGRAIAAIEATHDPSQLAGGSPTSRNRFALEVSPTASVKASPDTVRYAHDQIITQLRGLRGVTFTPEPGTSRYFVDTNVAKLLVGRPNPYGRVTVECDLSIIVATYPGHAIKMMATVGGSLEERNDPKGVADAKNFCLGDAAKQAAEKVQIYLKDVQ